MRQTTPRTPAMSFSGGGGASAAREKQMETLLGQFAQRTPMNRESYKQSWTIPKSIPLQPPSPQNIALHCQEIQSSMSCWSKSTPYNYVWINESSDFILRHCFATLSSDLHKWKNMSANSLLFPPTLLPSNCTSQNSYTVWLFNVPPLRWLSSFPWRSWEAFWNSISTEDICCSVCKAELLMPLPFLCCLLQSLATFSSESFSGWRSISAAE